MSFDPTTYDPTATVSGSGKGHTVRFANETSEVDTIKKTYSGRPSSPVVAPFEPQEFTTYHMSYYAKPTPSWAKSVAYVQPLHEASAANPLVPHQTQYKTNELLHMTTNSFGGKSASAVLISAAKQPAHLRATDEEMEQYQQDKLKSFYSTSNNDFGHFSREKFGSNDSLSATRKEIAALKRHQTQVIKGSSRTLSTNANVTNNNDYIALLTDNSAPGSSKHMHTTAAEKRRVQALEQRYLEEAKCALDVHTHTNHGAVIEYVQNGKNGGIKRQETLRSSVPSLNRTQNLQRPRTQGLSNTVHASGCKSHSVYTATACDCTPSVHDALIHKYGMDPRFSYPAGANNTTAQALARQKTGRITRDVSTKDGWQSSIGNRTAYSQSLSQAKGEHRKSAGHSVFPAPVELSVATQKEKDYLTSIYPSDFSEYNLIRTNLSMPQVYQSHYMSETHGGLNKKGFEPSHRDKHFKFGYLPKPSSK